MNKTEDQIKSIEGEIIGWNNRINSLKRKKKKVKHEISIAKIWLEKCELELKALKEIEESK